MLKNPLTLRLLKRGQMQGGTRREARDVLMRYVAASRERANAADGPFSATCYAAAFIRTDITLEMPSSSMVMP
jgi:hypothetical protein